MSVGFFNTLQFHYPIKSNVQDVAEIVSIYCICTNDAKVESGE